MFRAFNHRPAELQSRPKSVLKQTNLEQHGKERPDINRNHTVKEAMPQRVHCWTKGAFQWQSKAKPHEYIWKRQQVVHYSLKED